MRTDYQSPQFVGLYARRRALSESVVRFWAEQLAVSATAGDVDRVLDVGSGIGRFWPAFEAAWSPRVIVAVDSSFAMLAASTTQPANLVRITADIDSLPFNEGAQFDVAFCSMSIHYSSDPRACVATLLSLVRPGGWIYVRTGTHDTLRTFDFLPYFPTAKAAEFRAMPQEHELLDWLQFESLEILSVKRVVTGAVTSRRAACRLALSRGFPSLQLVPRGEWLLGMLRYASHLALTWLRRDVRQGEECVLLTARRTA